MFEKLTDEIISNIIIQLNKKENKTILDDNFIVPLCQNITDRIHPYLLIIFISYIIILILIIWIMFILIRTIE